MYSEDSEPAPKKARSRISEFLQPQDSSDMEEADPALIDFHEPATSRPSFGPPPNRSSLSVPSLQNIQEHDDLINMSFEENPARKPALNFPRAGTPQTIFDPCPSAVIFGISIPPPIRLPLRLSKKSPPVLRVPPPLSVSSRYVQPGKPEQLISQLTSKDRTLGLHNQGTQGRDLAECAKVQKNLVEMSAKQDCHLFDIEMYLHLDPFNPEQPYCNVRKVELWWAGPSVPIAEQDEPLIWQVKQFFFGHLKAHFNSKKVQGRVRELVQQISSMWYHAHQLIWEITNAQTRFSVAVDMLEPLPAKHRALVSAAPTPGSLTMDFRFSIR
ncbi:hypothetical protein PtB15_1B827 [Puccinia triticina]|nr:hypothetical protein PtB15_1B827 [Puccinia triticina]